MKKILIAGVCAAMLTLSCTKNGGGGENNGGGQTNAPSISSLVPDNGIAGASVTISGQYFSYNLSDISVSFNGVAATVLSATADRIVVTVPVRAGTGNVVVTVSGKNSGGKNFTYIKSAISSTYAGSGTAGNANGTGTAAQFNAPAGIAVDVSGNLYVADEQNHQIRKITTGGVVTVLAGTGTSGYADGPAANAQFSYPTGVAIDGSGNLYVADRLNHRIRKITAAGQVSTLAGSGAPGTLDGTGTAAKFTSPQAIAIDLSGNLYVGQTDYDGMNIRKITPSGVVTTVAGSNQAGYINGAPLTAKFFGPTGIAVTSTGNLYIADQNNHRIRFADFGAGQVSSFAGNGTNGFADGDVVNAQFKFPTGIAIDGLGNLYVTDLSNRRIRKINTSGTTIVSTIAGDGQAGLVNGPGASSRFEGPNGIAVDAQGNIFISEYPGHRIRKISFE